MRIETLAVRAGAEPDPVTGAVAPLGKALNISGRVDVGTGDNVAIGGFIVTGSDPKKVIVRGIGPSLQSSGVRSSGV